MTAIDWSDAAELAGFVLLVLGVLVLAGLGWALVTGGAGLIVGSALQTYAKARAPSS